MFRAEALEAQKQKLHGDVFLTQPVTFNAILFLVFAIVAVVVTLLVTGSYARSEHVTGHLVPSKGLVRLQASQFGTLSNFYVQEGDQVDAGQPLADIIVAKTTLDGYSVAKKSLEALAQQKAVLETQVALEQNQLEAELAQRASEKAETQLRITSLENRRILQQQITSSAKAAFTDVQEILGKGYISKVESERRRQTWLSQQAQEQRLAQEMVEANAKLEQLNIRLLQLPNESKQRLARLHTQITNLDGRLIDMEGQQAYSVTAPVKGRVVSVTSNNIGRSVQAGQPLLSILPEGSILEAELFVPSRAAGFVEKGQEVRLLYDAFPYQRFGSYSAKITGVTETILAPNETLSPFEIKEPVYRVTAAIAADEVMARGKEIALQSGMTLKANIVLERRSFLEWLLEPLQAAGGRS